VRGSPRSIPTPSRTGTGGVAFDVPGSAEYLPRAVVFTYTASAAAANRFVNVQYRDGSGNVYCVNAAGLVLVANDALRFCGSSRRGAGEWAANTDVLFPLEPLLLPAEHSIVITATNIQAADVISGITLLVEQFDIG
jgi:hypothetical protein